MFDLSQLRVVTRVDEADRFFGFVGLRKEPATGQLELWLPQGFQNFPTADFKSIVRIFFRLYGVIRTFARHAELSAEAPLDREPVALGEFGLSLSPTASSSYLTFAKLALLERTLDAFDEQTIGAILAKPAKRPPERFGNLHRHLERAIFNSDSSLFIAEVDSERREVVAEQTALVRLFCYVYTELTGWIGGRAARVPMVNAAADAFKEEFLPDTAGLFSEESFELTVQVLKDELEHIHRRTAYKDAEYWELFEALEAFLYGELVAHENEDGVVWGVKQFSWIWEDMGHVYLKEKQLRNLGSDIVYSASRRNRAKRETQESAAEALSVSFLGSKRRLSPDLVILIDGLLDSRRQFEDAVEVIPRGPAGGGVRDTVFQARESSGIRYLHGVETSLKSRGGFRKEFQNERTLIAHKTPTSVINQAIGSAIQKYKEEDRVYIIDFKYHPLNDFLASTAPPEKVRDDVLKQLAYEFALVSAGEAVFGHRTPRMESQFAIPQYLPGAKLQWMQVGNSPDERVGNLQTSQLLQDTKIKLFALPFDEVADTFIECG